MSRAPVREERPVDEILESLTGAPRERWLEKWMRWIENLIHHYHIDPAEIGYDPELIEDFLVEHCSGLVESECLGKVEELIREKGGRKTVEEIAEEWKDYMEMHFRKPDRICEEYGFDAETCRTVLEIKENPCRDHRKLKEVLASYIKYYFERMYNDEIPPEIDVDKEAERIAREILPSIPKCADWTMVLRPIRHRSRKPQGVTIPITRFIKVSPKAERPITEFTTTKPEAEAEAKPEAERVSERVLEGRLIFAKQLIDKYLVSSYEIEKKLAEEGYRLTLHVHEPFGKDIVIGNKEGEVYYITSLVKKDDFKYIVKDATPTYAVITPLSPVLKQYVLDEKYKLYMVKTFIIPP